MIVGGICPPFLRAETGDWFLHPQRALRVRQLGVEMIKLGARSVSSYRPVIGGLAALNSIGFYVMFVYVVSWLQTVDGVAPARSLEITSAAEAGLMRRSTASVSSNVPSRSRMTAWELGR